MILSICDLPDVLKVMRIVNVVIQIIRIVVPILLIVSAMIDLVRAINSAELNKITKPMVSKVVAAILVFLIPSFVRLIANIAGNDGEYEKCLNIVSVETINGAYNSQAEELVKKAEKSKDNDDYNTALTYLNNIKDESKKNKLKNRLNKVKEKIDEKNENSNTPGNNPTKDSGELKIYYFGVGRFDAHLIIGNNTVAFIDGGYESTVRKVIPYIKSLGITKIDYLIGSHLHDNHIKAHIEMIKNFKVGMTIYDENPGDCLRLKTCKSSSTNTSALMKIIKDENIPMTIMHPGLNQKTGGLTGM